MVESDSPLSSPVFYIRCVILFLCIICFGLTVQYPETEILMFDHSFSWNRTNKIIEFTAEVILTESGFVRLHFLTLATVGYTWIILPTILVCYFINGRQYMDKNVMCIILNSIAFLVFVVAGSLICATFNGSWDNGAKSTGVLCVMTSLLFLCDVCFVIYSNLKATRTISGSSA